jgi:protein involved in ribonucleotide reduction
MLVVYSSKTGNVKRFVNKLEGVRSISINEVGDSKVDEPYVLITYTTGFGEVPSEVEEFLTNNHENLIAVCSSGNRNWGENFAIAADKISHKYNVPILLKFELSGGKGDVEKFKERVQRIYEVYRAKQQNE